jgi:tRNA U34 5-carboxymethylaminomethyl modifying enzyme MnmG/GidA
MERRLTFTRLHGLSNEERQLLSKSRPSTLGAAKRIQGITPVAILELIRHTKNIRPVAGVRDCGLIEQGDVIGI